jgi:hypothetical protein
VRGGDDRPGGRVSAQGAGRHNRFADKIGAKRDDRERRSGRREFLLPGACIRSRGSELPTWLLASSLALHAALPPGRQDRAGVTCREGLSVARPWPWHSAVTVMEPAKEYHVGCFGAELQQPTYGKFGTSSRKVGKLLMSCNLRDGVLNGTT